MPLAPSRPELLHAPDASYIKENHLVKAMRMREQLDRTPEFIRAMIIDALMDRGLTEDEAIVVERISEILYETGMTDASLQD